MLTTTDQDRTIERISFLEGADLVEVDPWVGASALTTLWSGVRFVKTCIVWPDGRTTDLTGGEA